MGSDGKTRSWSPWLTWTVLIFVLFFGSMAFFILQFYYAETKGPYTFTSFTADLDLDGDLDIIMGRARYETAMTVWAGPILWINQGGGRFTMAEQELPGGLAVTGGDVDRDGDTDLITYDVNKATWVINQGGIQGGKAGYFPNSNPIIPFWFPSAFLPMDGSLALGDLNGDGRLDGLVTSCCNPVNDAQIDPATVRSWTFFGEANAGGRLAFRTALLSELDRIPVRATALGDLDGDGDLDIYAAVGSPNLKDDALQADRILSNDGSGNFSDSGQRIGQTNSTAVVLGDLDSDGDLDALVGTRKSAEVMVNGGGSQTGQAGMMAALGPALVGPETRGIFLEDFNQDGSLDALVEGEKVAYIWWNDGKAAFSRAGFSIRYKENKGLSVGDFNGDGLADIFAGSSDGSYTLWTNLGNGKFN